MLKLRLQYFGHLTQLKRPWYWERLKVGGEGDDREWDVWLASPTQWTWALVSFGSWWWTGRSGMLQPMGVTKSRTRLSNWTELNIPLYISLCQRTSRLLPCLGYCKQHCSEYRSACIFLNYGFLEIYAHEWDCCITWQFYFYFLKEYPYCSSWWLINLHSHQQCRILFSLYPLQH